MSYALVSIDRHNYVSHNYSVYIELVIISYFSYLKINALSLSLLLLSSQHYRRTLTLRMTIKPANFHRSQSNHPLFPGSLTLHDLVPNANSLGVHIQPQCTAIQMRNFPGVVQRQVYYMQNVAHIKSNLKSLIFRPRRHYGTTLKRSILLRPGNESILEENETPYEGKHLCVWDSI